VNTKLLTVIIFSLLFTSANAQTADRWSKWHALIGNWQGEGSGEPGKGSGTFSFVPDLNKNILVRKSHSEYPATANNPATIHDDLMVVYGEEDGDPTSAIYFDNEGHVIHYHITYSENTVVLTGKAGKGMTFRLTYIYTSTEKVVTRFEFSQDGVNFTTYVEGNSIKIK
jgi:hypothetical protein